MDIIAWIYCAFAVGMLLYVPYLMLKHSMKWEKSVKITPPPSEDPSKTTSDDLPDWEAAEAMIKPLDWPKFERRFKPGGIAYGNNAMHRLEAHLKSDDQLNKKLDDVEVFFGKMWEKYKDQKRSSYIIAKKHKEIAKLRRLRARTANPIKE